MLCQFLAIMLFLALILWNIPTSFGNSNISYDIAELLERTKTIENMTRTLLHNQDLLMENLLNKSVDHVDTAVNLDRLNKTEENPVVSKIKQCEEVAHDGLYLINGKEHFCMFNSFWWTIIQRRDNYSPLEDFNRTWADYKTGFGNVTRDFWIGNDFLAQFTQNPVILRVELEDFSGNTTWAEYSKFEVQPEADNYRLIIGSYRGNATDSFSSHNNSEFSTIDRKNDKAPECCPCSLSFGGGWWFNNCFECNLNGAYFKNPLMNNYFQGIIWETWLGNYSLKKAVMMVRKAQNPTDEWPYYEDP